MEERNVNMERKKYYLGIDAGTNSIGWCVTDENYNIIKKQNKHLWGSRLFEEAHTAKERRTNRSSRRRIARRRWRLHMLQDIFADEINKIDPYFFDRLNNSALHKEDKDSTLRDYKFLLFNGNNYTDKQYYKNYPTIYHLRQDILNNPDKKFDIRLIYLALAHMVKYRGNFLKEGEIKEVGKDPSDIIRLFNELDEAIAKVNELNKEDDDKVADRTFDFAIDDAKAKELLTIFKHYSGVSGLKDQEINSKVNINAPFSNIGTKSLQSIVLPLINGGKRKLVKIFATDDESDLEGLDEKLDVDFSSVSFVEDALPLLSTMIGEEKADVIIKAFEIYQLRIMLNILGDANGISEAFVKTYDDHKNQLRELKRLIKKYAKDEYDDFFRKIGDDKNPTYAGYIGSNNSNGVVERTKHFVKADILYKEVNKILDKASITEDDQKSINDIKEAIASNKYLLRQNSSTNGVLPYQLNENEMRKIIESQSEFYPFLLEKDKDFNNPNKQEYKIISILKFKVPYYVGPLTKREKENDSVNRWAVYKENVLDEPITPWNFSDIVDKEKTEQKFIERMKNTCTYMLGEPTLPKSSIIYSLFVVLNEMNNWLINGMPVVVEDKEFLLKELYFKDKNINLAKIKEALKRKYKDDVVLCSKGSGKEVLKEDIHASMCPYIDMKNAFGKEFITFVDHNIQFDSELEFVEDIILHMTALEDKATLGEYLNKQENITKEQKDSILRLKYRDWGKLSAEFLCGMKTDIVDKNTAEVLSRSILELLFETDKNLMEIYNFKDYSFESQVKQRAIEYIGDNKKPVETFIDNQPVAPAVKRTMRQFVKIVNELKHILNIDHFDSYFVECTRQEGEKKRTKSRKKRLEEIYKAAKIASGELYEQLNKTEDSRLQSKKVYLYFLQCGKSVYSGKEIILDNLENYDIDHIIPQAKVKDDSIDNIVLVEKELNNKKQDKYPFATTEILSKEGKDHVECLHEKGLMSKAKYARITRTKELTEQELVGFVNRQLTMTDQSVIGIRNLIDFIEDSKSKVVYSRASNVSDFRNMFDLIKVRDLNNLHHANDAYLNIVVGNVYNKVFSSCFDVEMLRERRKYFDQTKIDVKNLMMHDQFIPYVNTCVWKAPHGRPGETDYDEKGSTIELVRKYMSYQDPMVTHMVHMQSGFMNKTSLHTAKDADAMFPIKCKAPFNSSGWEKKYGGYSFLTIPYFTLVKSKNREGKDQYSLESIPTIHANKMLSLVDRVNYLEKEVGLKKPEIVIDKLLIDTELTLKNDMSYSKVAFTGKSNTSLLLINLSEPKFDIKHQKYLKHISSLLGTNLPSNKKKDLSKYKDNMAEIKEGNFNFTSEANIEMYDYLVMDVFEKACYKCLPGASSVFKNLHLKKDEFIGLSVINQIQVINELVKLIGTTRESSDLTLIKLAKNAGVKTMNKILKSGTQIIFNSVTGFYSKPIFTVPED